MNTSDTQESKKEGDKKEPASNTRDKIQASGEKAGYSLIESPFGKWILYRLFTAIAWYWLILRVFDKQLPFGIQIDRDYLITPFLLSWLILILAKRWWRVFFHFPYFLIFPFLMLFVLSRWAFKLLKVTMKLPIRAFRAAKSGAAIFLTLLGIIIGWGIAFLSHRPHARAWASLVAHIATYIMFLQSFRWASNPYYPLLAVIEFLSDKGQKFFEKSYVNPGLTDKGNKRQTALDACEWCLKIIDKIYEVNAPMKRGITAYTYKKILPTFTFGFLILYVVLATSFGLTLYEIERAWGTLIQGIPDTSTRLSYLYFSFLSQATAVPDEIKPISPYGQIWIVWVVMTGVLLLTILIGLLTTAVGLQGENVLAELRGFLEPVLKVSGSEPFEHQTCHCHINKRLTCACHLFVVL
ncbi:MAG: hypothetical protein AB1631_20850, partial [Acidobacteriota bacterium]